MNSFRFLERGIEAELERQRELLEAGGRSSRRRSTSTRRRLADPAALEGGRARLPLLPRARPGARWRRPRRCCARRARRCRSCRRRGASATRGSWACADDAATPARRRRRDRRLLRAGRRRAADGRRAAGRRQLGHRRAGRRRCARTARRSAAGSKVEPEALAALVGDGRGEEDLPRQRQAGARGWSPRAATRPRSSSARASARSRDAGELEAIVAAAIEAEPEAAEQVRAGNEKAIGAIVGAVMKETKGRADGGEVKRLIQREARSLTRCSGCTPIRRVEVRLGTL